MDDITLRQFLPSDQAWLVAEHQDHYAREEGFDQTFGPLVAQILDDFIASHDPAFERGWIAERHDHRLGSIFCVRLDEDTAKLRLFLLRAEARGMGLGREMLATCMRFAQAKGYKRMQLWTHESHQAAGALYARAGWALTDTKSVVSFGKANIEQTWRIEF